MDREFFWVNVLNQGIYGRFAHKHRPGEVGAILYVGRQQSASSQVTAQDWRCNHLY